ncbi:hypothetical protein MNBD_GAMMA09-386 [hydrothermal vent metagenome]|uniref:Uncharacterized protein n=1 Tax=hydrothermal vent metagenome TaxID=652676 RepID=A0A3B0XX26_9ZZZZ
MTTKKIEGTAEAWENDLLGSDPKHAKKSTLKGAAIDTAMDLQMISIRLQKTLLVDLKKIATINGIGYQPLMKQILKRFVDSEMRKMANECLIEHMKEEQAEAAPEPIEELQQQA